MFHWFLEMFVLIFMSLICDMWCLRDDLDADEYEETRSETVEQLREFNESLSRMKEGDLSLVDDVNRIQLVISSSTRLCLIYHGNFMLNVIFISKPFLWNQRFTVVPCTLASRFPLLLDPHMFCGFKQDGPI